MAYLTVTTQADVVAPGDGQLSLREAIAQAIGSDTIRFSASVVGKTLVLTGGELSIGDDLTIDGNNGGTAPQTTIDAEHKGRVLSITGGGTEAKLSGLVITNGNSNGEPGGGIFLDAQANLTLKDSAVTSNDTRGAPHYNGDGGGLFANIGASLTIERTTFASNIVANTRYTGSGGYGGAVAVRGVARLVVRNSSILDNRGTGGGLAILEGSTATIEDTTIANNWGYFGGGALIESSTAAISRSIIANNLSDSSGGGVQNNGQVRIFDSTIVGNSANYMYATHCSGGGEGGGISTNGSLTIQNTTISGNIVTGFYCGGTPGGNGGGFFGSGIIDITNSIVAGNSIHRHGIGPDINGTITFSNGHNVFGSDVAGNVPGDRENFAAAALFAAVDPTTGGGKLGLDGTVALKNSLANPALSAGDPLGASALDQRGTARPQPAGSLPDLGAVELKQPLSTGSTVNNDVRSGTNAANNLTGLAGNDTMDGGNGSDVLDGGPGNDKLTGGTGVDLVAYPGTAPVVVDLSGTNDTAKRGGETDTLIGIEGALGSSGADRFKGDALSNEFQGKAGKDVYAGGSSRDTYDFNDVADSPAGATRDVVTDFDPSTDVLDLAGIDADSTVPGNQSFRWVAKATLTGAAQLGYFVSGGMTIVRASTDADAVPEVEIQLIGAKTLTEGDFRP